METVVQNGSECEDSEVNDLVTELLEQNEILSSMFIQKQCEENSKKAEVERLKNEMISLREKISNMEIESKEIDEKSKIKCLDDKKSEEIQRLLSVYDRLKYDEKQFKEMCNLELERLQLLVSQDDIDTSQNQVEAQLQKARSRIEAGKEELGAINRKLALLKRQVEQVPNRMELREYRLRFGELYNQVSATHRQTKQFFSLYNSLEDTKRYLEKELSLLNSIIDSYHQVSHTMSGRMDFLRQLSSLHEGMKESSSKIDSRHRMERISVEKLQQELQRLLDQKVAYEKCLKELETECKNNDQLLATLKKKESTK